ncbi:Succinate-semialdehyde dehydrogenase [Colletotrichum viniferum]|nr:Succinate-semialdehyde dehydrogenase [Colletotrichum viniferum]
MITRKAWAAVAAGCTTVWEPAGETPLSCIAQGVLTKEAGFPQGSINIVLTLDRVAEVGEAFCKSLQVQKISFTGSTRVGKRLAEQCGQTLNKLSLELGSTSPLIVFEDADLDRAVEILMLAKLRNSGRTCVTPNRMQNVESGEVILGGSLLPELGGNFIQPTLMTNMKQEMITTREEVFAPVLGPYQFGDETEAITLANSSNVGLGSFVITESIIRSWRVAGVLVTGMVGINVGSLSACESGYG